ITFRIGDEDEKGSCATAREKSELYNRIYWRLRALPTEDEIHARVDEIAARHGVDMRPLREELCMDWDEIRALAADPLATIGAHTVNHVMLAKASDGVARAELERGRQIVEAQLGREVAHLAYPYGGRDIVGAREFRLASEIGYRTAVTTRPG